MNIDVLEAYLEVVRQKSIAKASERLNLTHPALSKQMRKLEQYYGVTLLKRSSTGVEATDAGQLLYERLGPILADLARVRTELLQHAGEGGRWRIGTLPSLAAGLVPESVVSMERRGLQADVVVRHTSDELYGLLLTGELDAAVLEETRAHPSLWSRRLFTEPLYAMVPLAHRFAAAESVGAGDLAAEPLVLHPPTCGIRRRVTELLRSQGLEPQVKSEVAFGDFLLGYAAAGAGVAVLPAAAAERAGQAGLRAVPIRDPEACRTIALIAASAGTGRRLAPFFRVKSK